MPRVAGNTVTLTFDGAGSCSGSYEHNEFQLWANGAVTASPAAAPFTSCTYTVSDSGEVNDWVEMK